MNGGRAEQMEEKVGGQRKGWTEDEWMDGRVHREISGWVGR